MRIYIVVGSEPSHEDTGDTIIGAYLTEDDARTVGIDKSHSCFTNIEVVDLDVSGDECVGILRGALIGSTHEE